jgi:hypothetical protein
LTPVKVNIYISYTIQDKGVLEKLLYWLYPMRDEVNIWFVNPPDEDKIKPMPAPWNFLFFWYEAPDPMEQYKKVLTAQIQRAHIYIFLTNYRALVDQRVAQEIEFAVKRRIDPDHALNPLIFPLITSPCNWQKNTRISGYKPLGSDKKSLSEAKQEEEAYLEITQQLTKAIRSIQITLNEAKYALSQMTPEAKRALKPNPYLEEDTEATTFRPPKVSYPPEWLGWAIILLIFISIAGAVYRQNPRIIRKRGDNAEQQQIRPQEFRRENPIMPPPEADSTNAKPF